MVCPEVFARRLVLCSLALIAAQAFAQGANKTIVMRPEAFAVSGPMREMPIIELSMQQDVLPVRPGPLASHHGPDVKEDAVLQKEILPLVSATLGVSFSGLGATCCAPPDDNLAVGPNDILQTVNVQFAVYSKTGTLLHGPVNFTTFFSALGGNCASGSSDPIALYDRQAGRWIISDVGIGKSSFSECYGVSKTNDATGAYFLYAFNFGTHLNDYPKVGVWPTASNSAYLSTYNIFQGNTFIGAELCGFDRTKALAGDKTAAQLCRQTPNNDCCYLPSDNDGPTPPADGTPGLFLAWFNNNPGQLYLRKLTLNFAAGTSSLSVPTVISVANDNLTCGGSAGSCVPQEGTTQKLDTLGDRLMHRFPIRHFSDHDRATASHAVATSGGQVAFRWYELYDPAGAVTLNQQGTFAPDTTYRWMGSMAEDKNGDIAIGYSTSSSSIHPSIYYTGRVPSDPAGTLESEAKILAGTGSQTSNLNRWGDYTGIQIDPTDDCTFWYTDQYEPSNGTFNWATNIASFKFTSCGGGGGTPVVSLSTTSLNFGKEPIGQTSKAKPVKLTNTGTGTLNISSITVSGDFAISNKTCGTQVLAGSSCSVSVTFTPTAKGTRTGTLSFNDNAAGSPQTVTLSGTGVSLVINPTSWNYSTVTVGQTSSPKAFTVTNVSSSAVTFSGFSIGGTDPSDFKISKNTCGATLAGGANCVVSIEFKPTASGARSATLKVASNGGGSPQTAKLSGTGG